MDFYDKQPENRVRATPSTCHQLCTSTSYYKKKCFIQIRKQFRGEVSSYIKDNFYTKLFDILINRKGIVSDGEEGED